MFSLVLLDGILEDFSKFKLFIVENCILISLFWGTWEQQPHRSSHGCRSPRNSDPRETLGLCLIFIRYNLPQNKMHRLLVTLTNTLSRIVTRFFESKCTHFIVARTF
jgi:hypothetical protein